MNWKQNMEAIRVEPVTVENMLAYATALSEAQERGPFNEGDPLVILVATFPPERPPEGDDEADAAFLDWMRRHMAIYERVMSVAKLVANDCIGPRWADPDGFSTALLHAACEAEMKFEKGKRSFCFDADEIERLAVEVEARMS